MAVPPEIVRWIPDGIRSASAGSSGPAATLAAAKVLKMAREANGGEGGTTTVWGGERMVAVNSALALGTLPTSYHEATMSDFGRYEYGYRARDGFLIAKSVPAWL